MFESRRPYILHKIKKSKCEMENFDLKQRVQIAGNKFDILAADDLYGISLEKLTKEEIEDLENIKDFPRDMLLILSHLGCMRKWASGNALVVEWWVPCTIEIANSDDRCVYEILPTNFKEPEKLRFFAFDVDARCYFYDTSYSPWKLVFCDGLEASIYNRNPENYDIDWDGLLNPYEEEKIPDMLTMIEILLDYHGS